MYGAILVPTDGSTAATRATDGALALAERFDASVHAVHFVRRDTFPADVEDEATKELVARGDALVSAIADSGDDRDVPVRTQVRATTRAIHREIVDYVADHDIDLVVMGTHGRTKLNRLILGSIAERTLRRSPVPVLTVHDETVLDAAFERILVPTDGSGPADDAVDHAIRLAVAADAAIHVVHVVDRTVVPDEETGGPVLESLEAVGRAAVEDVIARAEAAGVHSVEASVLSGAPAQAIVDYAADRDADLVVMGTHGRSGVDRYLLGSVTEKVVRLAEAPVLSVSPPEEDNGP